MGRCMTDEESKVRLKRRLGDYWFFYGDHVTIIIVFWIIFFIFKYYEVESKYLPKALYALIAGTAYVIFSFFRVLLRKTLDNDMLP